MAVLHQGVQGAHGFLDRRRRVEPMDLVQVDMVQLKARQTLLHAVQDVQARIAARIHTGAGLAEDLGGDDHVVARPLQVTPRLSGDHFRPAFGVHVRRVDEIDARIQCPAHQPVRVLLLQGADLAPQLAFAAESHRAQAEIRDEQAGAAKCLVPHDSTPSGGSRPARPGMERRTLACRGEDSMRPEGRPRAA
ncbi:hypothetical protein G6F31_010266 [Rhizopus arrhizus]|nr:hypothetical protein G6F31_010266 [Rhizopus arrhizus]